MKNAIFKTLFMLFAMLLVTACEEENIMISKSLKLVGFSSPSLVIGESETGAVSIFYGSTAGKSVTVTLVIDTTGISNPAKEGTDYTISTLTPQLTTGNTEITITTIDNDQFTGDKSFDIVITAGENYETAAENTIRVTISDDEHPLKNWLGTYGVEAVSYDVPGVYDDYWNVTISPVPGALDSISVTGIAGSTIPVKGVIDKDNFTISFDSEQNLGEVYGPDDGNVYIYYGGDMMDYIWNYCPSEILTAAALIPISGTVAPDGSSISIDNWATIWIDYPWIYDVYLTTWTKQ